MRTDSENWTPERRARWEKTRRRGKIHFIWVRGAGVWGILMTFFATLVQWGGLALMSLFSSVSALDFGQIFLINLFLCPIGGLIWGVWAWTTTENGYRRAVEKSAS